MTWTTGVQDLRTHLSDGPTDRYNFRKRCFGECNGVNTRFKTFEFRRVTDFTVATDPEGLFLNGVLIPASAVSQDFVNEGVFLLSPTGGFVPQDGDILEASYYIQWFLDSELDDFLQKAALSQLNTSDYTTLSGGLISSAIELAASLAYKKMAQRWRDYISSNFKVEDAPRKEGEALVKSYQDFAESSLKSGLQLRDDVYKMRQGRAYAPISSTIRGNVRNYP